MKSEWYAKVHDAIIDRAQTPQFDWKDRQATRMIRRLGFERHHIQPRSIGGRDEPGNFVWLTYREHFLVHWLLTRTHTGQAKRTMQLALAYMANARNRLNRRIISSWQYALAKKCTSEASLGRTVSKETRKRASEARRGVPWAEWRRGFKHSEETKKKISEAKRGRKTKLSEEGRRRISETLMGNRHGLGYRHTEEAKRKIAEAGRGRHYKRSEGFRKKMSEAKRGIPWSEKRRAAQRQRMTCQLLLAI